MLKIKEIQAEETYNLRLKVLKTCDAYVYKYKCDFDKETKHFGAFLDIELIGIVTVMEKSLDGFSEKQIQLRGMAVSTEFQGKNIGKQLVRHIEKQYKNRGFTRIWCNARDYAVPFYTKLNFEIIGKKFYIENVCFHYKMTKII